MTTDKKLKTITIDKRHAAYGLYCLAGEHYEKANEYFEAMKDFLGTEDPDYRWSDAVFGDRGTFDGALATEFTVAPAKKRRRKP